MGRASLDGAMTRSPLAWKKPGPTRRIVPGAAPNARFWSRPPECPAAWAWPEPTSTASSSSPGPSKAFPSSGPCPHQGRHPALRGGVCQARLRRARGTGHARAVDRHLRVRPGRERDCPGGRTAGASALEPFCRLLLDHPQGIVTTWVLTTIHQNKPRRDTPPGLLISATASRSCGLH